jgi:RNA polymerase sigma-70 factor (ECF subfamily)
LSLDDRTIVATQQAVATWHVLDVVFREHSGRVLAALIRSVRDFDLAEDALQDAYIEAVETWPRRGIPANPAAWLLTTGRRRAIDRIRRAANLRRKHEALAHFKRIDAQDRQSTVEPDEIADERLRLIFTCCHPALALDARVALTLRTVGGLTTAEIAGAFLVPEATMGQRLSRAKRKIRDAGIPFEVPGPDRLSERLAAVLAVIYLIFNEGYSAGDSDGPARGDLVNEAANLAEIVVTLMPDEPEALGLLALILFQDARRGARIGPDGEAVLLKDQDRSKWDPDKIRRAQLILDRALGLRRPGAYQFQAAIAALHSEARSVDGTDWAQIALLYDRLYGLSPSPVVRLNHAVAVAEACGAPAGLRMLEEPDVTARLADYAHFHVARGELLHRLGRRDEALSALRVAEGLARSDMERQVIRRRIAALNAVAG